MKNRTLAMKRRLRFDTATAFTGEENQFHYLAREETKMSLFEHVSSPKIADETIGGNRKGDFADLPIPMPISESEFLKRSASFSKSSKKKFRFRRKGIIIATILGLATGIAIGGEWSSPHTFIENLKATNLGGVVETIFAGSSKVEQSAQPMAAAADATGHKLSEIADQLVEIASELSSVQQNIKELAGGQEQIRKTQEQLAQTQSRFAVSQTQANLKQNAQTSSQKPDGRKINARDVYFPWRYILYGD